MQTLAIILILFSTVMHAGWNLLARQQRRESEFFVRMLMVSTAVGFLPAAISEALTRSLPPAAWACALGSGLCCGLYYLFLARAYRSADFTAVYPVARALPVLLVGLTDVLRGRPPTAIGWLGMGFVAGGALLAPLHSFREFSLRRYWNKASLWMLLTALGTVGYTLLDKIASEVVSRGPATAARYGYVFFATSLAVYAVALRVSGVGKIHAENRAREEQPIGWTRPACAAVLNFASYWLVLWAYQLSRRAGYIVAFRQFSIVVGVVLGFALFKERGLAVRLAGTLLITLGLVLIAMWGS